MDPGILIPVKGYGGIERIIEMLAKEHLRNGHEVHLLLTNGSFLEGCIVHGIGKEGFPPNKWDARKAIPAVWKFLWKNKNEFDLIHNFGRLIYLLPVLKHPVKKIMSYQREITRRNILWINAMTHKNLLFTGCSQNLINRARVEGNWETVYNACDFNKYSLQDIVAVDAPLIFLGRIEKIKGCHTAISVARATGHKLIIAGNISTLPEEKDYFEKEIAPHIDGDQIQYIGTVNDEEKNEWLGKSRAMLFPIEWNEPFGIVMVEAMACGTPVIGFNYGSVNEVIDEGITGFKVNSIEGMISAVEKITEIDRNKCRDHARKRFDISIIAKRYLNLVNGGYKTVLILTTHQPAANPRAMKEYNYLKEAGFMVKFLFAYNAEWSYQIDEQKFKNGKLPRQDFIEVAGNPHTKPIHYLLSRIVYRLSRDLARIIPSLKPFSTSRAAIGLWKAVGRYKADLYIAHYLGALPAAEKGSRIHKAPLIFDAEDFHRGEQSYYVGQVKNIIDTEELFLPAVNAITTASRLIGREYKKLFPAQTILTVNNAFSRKYLQPIRTNTKGTLKLFWFSQNIGPYRGLEIFMEAMNELPAEDISLTIMGNRRSAKYERDLLSLSGNPSRIIFKEPVFPKEIFAVAASHDIGLAGEVPNCYNKEICLSNKIFAYLLAGNCLLASNMEGQEEFMYQNPGIGFLYKHDDPADLAGKIKLLYDDRVLLQACKERASKLADQKMNWEEEQQEWVSLVKSLLNE